MMADPTSALSSAVGNDVFVTDDGRIHNPTRKSTPLALGAGDILRPDEAVAKSLGASDNSHLC